MSTILTNYSYYVNLSYINGSTVTPIDQAAIQLVVIDYDYENSHAPVALVEAKIDVAMFNDMVKNKETSKILLEVQRFDKDAVSKITKTIIKKQLSYLLSHNQFEFETTEADNNLAYKSVTLGLIDTDAVNDNRKIINNLYRNTNLMTMCANELSKAKLIIEPFENNKTFDLFFIPPLEGIHKFLEYMNRHCAFYSTDYRYFQDWNGYTYILSNKGKGIDINDGSYTTVKIEIVKDLGIGAKESAEDGVVTDIDQKLYTIKCPVDNYTPYKNNVSDNITNQIYAISSEGNSMKNNLNINPISNSKVKPKFIRVSDDNTDYAKSLGNKLELTSNVANIVAFEIDNNIVVPYKEFIVKNQPEYSDRDGNYILSSKKEVYISDAGGFRNTTTFTLKKIKS